MSRSGRQSNTLLIAAVLLFNLGVMVVAAINDSGPFGALLKPTVLIVFVPTFLMWNAVRHLERLSLLLLTCVTLNVMSGVLAVPAYWRTSEGVWYLAAHWLVSFVLAVALAIFFAVSKSLEKRRVKLELDQMAAARAKNKARRMS